MDRPLHAGENARRLRLTVRGAVQGVGFRPFVYQLACELRLAGWVRNSTEGVEIELEGDEPGLHGFLERLSAEKPERSHIQQLETHWFPPAGHRRFQIVESDPLGSKTAVVQADIATCPACLAEVLEPTNRRYLYPFTNCTHCGPRFSIVESVPYDRINTSMREFRMCAECRAEYDDPSDRRFHAQPNACPSCGPHLELWDDRGGKLQERHDALLGAVAALRQGRIVAVKGLGGFHLITSAHCDESVHRLRERKHREEKPFALMMASAESVASYCRVSPFEKSLLLSPEAPIVLLGRLDPRNGAQSPPLSAQIAPGNPNLGVMLPSNPLHHLLMRELGSAVVATSGNVSDEPICTDEHAALQRLKGIADLFLVHDRRIVRQVDDSIVRVMIDREMVLRRARGFAPLPIRALPPVEPKPAGLDMLPEPPPFANSTSSLRETGACPKILAVGAHQKSAVGVSFGPDVFISQHLGDLDSAEALKAFDRATLDLPGLYDMTPEVIVADLHPDYASTREALRLAKRTGARFLQVQHHEAHVLGCMAENGLTPPVLGVAWDGTGYGRDGTIWGGEFFRVAQHECTRIAHLRTFPLPGGDVAAQEPRRSAFGLCSALAMRLEDRILFDRMGFSQAQIRVLRRMLTQGINCTPTSSIGRLFDAVASLVGLRQVSQFEGQAAMDLEFAACAPTADPRGYVLPLSNSHGASSGTWCLDWEPLILQIIHDVDAATSVPVISHRFHRALAQAIVEIAKRTNLSCVVLSGGCFQNRLLTELTVSGLREAGLFPYWHQRVPPNDGGICLGQIVAVRRLDL